MAKLASVCVLWNLSGHFFFRKMAAMICTFPFQKDVLLTLPSEHRSYPFLLADQPISIIFKSYEILYTCTPLSLFLYYFTFPFRSQTKFPYWGISHKHALVWNSHVFFTCNTLYPDIPFNCRWNWNCIFY